MIIIEGMDNSGKSTLARSMAEYMSLFVQESEGPPKSPEEINERVDRYEGMEGYLFVRHPVISNSIYGTTRPEGNPITPGRQMLFYEARHTLIYCDPVARGLEGHDVKDHDSEEHLKNLTEWYQHHLRLYRVWAAQHAHFIYRIGDDMDQLISTVYFYDQYSKS